MARNRNRTLKYMCVVKIRKGISKKERTRLEKQNIFTQIKGIVRYLTDQNIEADGGDASE